MVNYLRENLPDSFEISTKTTGSQILISSLSPYLKIISNDNKTLLNIADNSYYLQTNDFVQHILTNGEFTTKGQGMKLDLQNGKITSYNFDLLALDSSDGNNAGSYIRLSESGNPYLRVHFEDKAKSQKLNILEITKTNFYLCSHNWEANKEGINIDLTNGRITAFNNFNLKATINTTNQNDKRYNGSYVQIKSGDPFFTVHFEDSYSPKKSLDLIKIGINNWFMQSQDWVSGKSGIRFDMAKGKITAYSFTIKAYRSENEYIYIDSTADIEPLKIGSKFKVNWRGEVTASYITASGGKIGPFTINDTSLYIKNSATGGIGIDTAEVYLGDNGLSVNSGKFRAYRTSRRENFPLFSLLKDDKDRYIGIKTDDTHTFTYSTYIEGGIFIKDGGMKVEGSLYTSGTTTIGSKLYVTANTYIGGSLTTMGTLSINSTAYINGGTTINGDLIVNGNIRGRNWGVTNNNDNTKSTQSFGNISATGGTIGGQNGWSIKAGLLQDTNGIIKLNAKEAYIEVHGLKISKDNDNNGQITFVSGSYIYEGTGGLYIVGSNKVKGNVNIQSNVHINDLYVTSLDNINIGAGPNYKHLGELALADDIKKKFSTLTVLSSTNYTGLGDTYYSGGNWYYKTLNDPNMTLYKRDDYSSKTMYEAGSSFSYNIIDAGTYSTVYYDSYGRPYTYISFTGNSYYRAAGESISFQEAGYVVCFQDINRTSGVPVNIKRTTSVSGTKIGKSKTVYDYEALSSSDFGKIPDTLNLVSDEITMVASEVTDTSSDTIALGQMHKNTR